jgi:hypothetical protein
LVERLPGGKDLEQRDILREVLLQPAAGQDADVDFPVQDRVHLPLNVALIEHHLRRSNQGLRIEEW